MSLALTEGNWWKCAGNELWVINLRQSNFVTQSDKCDRHGGNQALKRDPGTGVKYCEISINTFFHRTPPVDVFEKY